MWNYRVLRHNSINGDVYYQIHEVYYDKGENPTSCSVNAIPAMGETTGELRRDLDMMLNAFNQPVLEYDYFTTLSPAEESE
jgi:hypothetical protein